MTKNLKIILMIVMSLSLISCEKENTLSVPNDDFTPQLDNRSTITANHFFDILTSSVERIAPDGTKSSGITAPKIWRKTFYTPESVKVYLDSSVSDSDKEVIQGFLTEVESIIVGSGITFSFTDNIDEMNIGIVNGSSAYRDEIFGITGATPPDYWFGGVQKRTTCRTLTKTYMWYDPDHSREKTIKHELGHCLGLSHAESGSSLMYHNLGAAEESLSEMDMAVLKLAYYNGVYGPLFANTETEEGSCEPDEYYLLPGEEEEIRNKIRLILENDFN